MSLKTSIVEKKLSSVAWVHSGNYRLNAKSDKPSAEARQKAEDKGRDVGQLYDSFREPLENGEQPWNPAFPCIFISRSDALKTGYLPEELADNKDYKGRAWIAITAHRRSLALADAVKDTDADPDTVMVWGQVADVDSLQEILNLQLLENEGALFGRKSTSTMDKLVALHRLIQAGVSFGKESEVAKSLMVKRGTAQTLWGIYRLDKEVFGGELIPRIVAEPSKYPLAKLGYQQTHVGDTSLFGKQRAIMEEFQESVARVESNDKLDKKQKAQAIEELETSLAERNDEWKQDCRQYVDDVREGRIESNAPRIATKGNWETLQKRYIGQFGYHLAKAALAGETALTKHFDSYDWLYSMPIKQLAELRATYEETLVEETETEPEPEPATASKGRGKAKAK